MTSQTRVPDRYGYYLFLGVGDCDAPSSLTHDWTSTWDFSAWRQRLEDLVRLGTNTLFIFLMGDKLPFRSDHYPECVESGHPNVKSDFFQQVLDRAIEKGIEVVAVCATTGHARGYARAHPDLAIRNRQGRLQVGSGILCHNRRGARSYALNVIEECLTRYHGFSGVVLHPPEFTDACFCEACQSRYREEWGAGLLAVSDGEARRFFMETNLSFQKTEPEAKVRRLLPGAKRLTFTNPWVFEEHFEKIAGNIGADTVIIDWDYDLSDERIRKLQSRLRRYQQFGHKVWFMPTCGYMISDEKSEEAQESAVLSQIRLALEADAKGIIYFMGPKWSRHVEGTSFHLNE